MILQGSKDRKSVSGYAGLKEARPSWDKRHTVFYSKTKPDYSRLTTLIHVRNITRR